MDVDPQLQLPFHCVRFVERQQGGASQDLLIASAGRKLYSYAADSGRRLSVWPQDANNAQETVKDIEAQQEEKDQEPPGKKRKTDTSNSAGGKKPKSLPDWTHIPILTISSTGKYVVALTAEDKCIRVFQIAEDGSLKELSERGMPKRPCALAVTGDDSTILCADKFGDVYSLPLIPSETPYVAPKEARPAKPIQPAASNLTVHSKRNLASLEQQMMLYKQGKWGNPEEKSSLGFEHQLLLGHVSLLTDLAFVSFPDSKRSYILTADRDEHVRVSRGPPQAHVIENYCLGHTSFITKLCIPAWAPQYLVTGGGDNYLLVWKWSEGRVLQKVPLVADNSEIVVRDIWAAALQTSPSETSKVILVAIDGSPRLLCFSQEADGSLKEQGSVAVSGNVIDVTPIEKSGTIVIAVDDVHNAGSIQEWRSTPTNPPVLLESFRVKPDGQGLAWDPVTEPLVATINSEGTSQAPTHAESKQRKDFSEALYGLKNLRKMRMGEDD